MFFQSQIDTLKSKLANMEDERDALKDSEQRMSEKVAELLEQLQEAQVGLEDSHS